MSIGAINQPNVDLLRSIASAAYGSREGWKGGAGNIGMVDGKVVKFNTHFAERRVKLDEDDQRAMCRIGNDLRRTLGGIAQASLNGDSADLTKIRELLGLNANNEVTEGAKRKLLDRKVVAQVVTRLLDANDQAGVDKKAFLDEASAIAKTSKNRDTSVVELKQQLENQKILAGNNEDWEPVPDEAIGTAFDVNGAFPSEEAKTAYYQRRQVYLNRISDGIVHELLSNSEFKALFENPEHQPHGAYLKQQLLKQFSGCDALVENSAWDSKHLQKSIEDRLWRAVFDNMSNSEADGVSFSTLRHLANPDGVQRVVLNNLKTSLAEAMERISALKQTQANVDHSRDAPGIPTSRHPTLASGFQNCQLGQFFKQGKNTCFMMSIINAMMSNPRGLQHLKAICPGNGSLKYISDPEDQPAEVSSVRVDEVPSKLGFTELERTLFEIHKLEDAFGDDRLGKMCASDNVMHKLGYSGPGDNFQFALGTSYSQRLKNFLAVCKHLKQNEGNICLLYRGSHISDICKHYMAIVDTYVNPDDPNDFGFWVKDSQTGKPRKIRAEFGGDDGFPLDKVLTVLTFRPGANFERMEAAPNPVPDPNPVMVGPADESNAPLV